MKKTDFDIHFDHAFATVNQSRFEDWFARMASRIYGTDFELIKAGGKNGDKKSDGRRISTETIFQCYAPESPKTFAERAKAKISDSFPMVKNYWPDLKEWIFVHNNIEGLPTSASDKLEELRRQYSEISISTACRNFLKDELHDKLSMQQMIDIYPSASLNFNAVQMSHIRPLLKKIIEARSVNPDPLNFGDIPDEEKLDFNRLSPDSKYDIRRARPHIDIVDRYLDGMPNPQNASIIQAEMRAKYLELKGFGYDPDEIMGKLLVFCGGGETATVSAAAYVIVAYYLDACDIFENVPQGAPC
ncbi:hypothetical protein EOJ32_17260 (plasmid) [Paracoccus sp. Arc7-R13]|uniref:ABC-three component system protein n=1 Tax=Paracoccus sp. Arc7-R13 TaxID=2500532 RepID=UPI000FDA31D4|nr:ABC-three component system protein [Paracoccus sp. Arc7-R13]AZY95549.1 hypothetical protein EOJ32_17260 [Paracoccus sp. Arc7-R13]